MASVAQLVGWPEPRLFGAYSGVWVACGGRSEAIRASIPNRAAGNSFVASLKPLLGELLPPVVKCLADSTVPALVTVLEVRSEQVLDQGDFTFQRVTRRLGR